LKLSQGTAETETEVAESPAGTRQTEGGKLGLVWRNRKKISQIINDYLCLPFFLLIILWILGWNEQKYIMARRASENIPWSPIHNSSILNSH
jgi:hypothetical protein